MKNKKILSIFVVAIFIFTSISVAAGAREVKNSNDSLIRPINDTGTVYRDDSSRKNPFLIKADEGVDYLGLHFDTYLPMNLDPEYSQVGLRVGFNARISRIISIRTILQCIYYRAIPIFITDIWRLGDENGSLNGRVSGEEGSHFPMPLPDAKIELFSNKLGPIDPLYETTTDDGGQYEINGVKADQYIVVASKQGYESQTEEIEIKPDDSLSVNFILKKQPVDPKVELTLNTEPWGMAPQVFELDPEPLDYKHMRDGKIHAIYNVSTEVRITASEEIEIEGEKYVFERWLGEAEGNDNPLTVMMDRNKSITGYYRPNSTEICALNIEVVGCGTTDPIPGITHLYPKGTEVEITALLPEMPGAEFLGWDGDAEGTENPITVTMDSCKHVIAIFSDPQEIVPPKVETLESERDGDKVTLKGKILKDGGEACTVFFEIKRPIDREWHIVEVEGKYNTDDVFSISHTLNEYNFVFRLHYRACASNSAGQSKGQIKELRLI